jgi:hypothetical protein
LVSHNDPPQRLVLAWQLTGDYRRRTGDGSSTDL